MQMKAKQAEKLEEQEAEEAEELAALQEDMELPLNLKAGGAVDGFLIQLMNVGFGYPGELQRGRCRRGSPLPYTLTSAPSIPA